MCEHRHLIKKKQPCTMIIKKIIYNSNIFVHRFFHEEISLKRQFPVYVRCNFHINTSKLKKDSRFPMEMLLRRIKLIDIQKWFAFMATRIFQRVGLQVNFVCHTDPKA